MSSSLPTPVASSLPSIFHSALAVLLRAEQYARDLEVDPWQFAVELSSLSNVGLSTADLRWLERKGLVEHAEEISDSAKADRLFRLSAPHFLSHRSCFILTSDGLAIASGFRPQPSMVTNESKPTPKYFPDLRELWLNGELMKRFRVPAKNQELILTVFEEEGWPPHIDDPLPPEQEMAPTKRLQDATRRLNQNLRRGLRFLGDGSGSGLRWEAAGN